MTAAWTTTTTYHRIWRALKRVRATMEPYPSVSRHGRHTVDEWLEFMDLFGLDSKKTSKKNYEPTEEELLAEKRMGALRRVLQPPAVGHRREVR